MVGGRLYYEGRLDSQVKVRGHRVDLTEIEKAVRDLEAVSKTIVLCYKPGQPSQKLLCYYTVAEGARLPEKKVLAEISEKLPDYMLPRLTKLAVMPVLVNGKIDRQALFQRYEEHSVSNKFSFLDSDMAEFVGPDLYNEARSESSDLQTALRIMAILGPILTTRGRPICFYSKVSLWIAWSLLGPYWRASAWCAGETTSPAWRTTSSRWAGTASTWSRWSACSRSPATTSP